MQRWERLRTLANPRTRMDTSLVDFEISEPQPDGSAYVHTGRELTLTSVREGDDFRPCRLRLRVRNRSPQPLHFVLLNLSPQWGIHRLANEPLPARSGWTTRSSSVSSCWWPPSPWTTSCSRRRTWNWAPTSRAAAARA